MSLLPYDVVYIYAYFYILFNTILTIHCDSLIKLHFKWAYQLPFAIGNSSFYTLSVSLTNQSTWFIARTGYESNILSESQILGENIEMKYRSEEYKGMVLSNTIYLDEFKTISIDNFPFNFCVSPSILTKFKGKIGFSYQFKEENYSIVHQFKQRGLIDRLAFSFVFTKFGSNLYLGGIPDNITSSHFHSYCDVIGLSHYWDCYVTKISINAKEKGFKYDYQLNTTDINGYMYYNNDESFIYAPKAFLKQIGETYLSYELSINKCSYTTISLVTIFTCAFNNNYLSGRISFEIGDYVYDINLNSLWMCDMDYCDFQIGENPEGDYWVFGSSFLIQLKAMFDYEGKKVNFYSLNENEKKIRVYKKGQYTLKEMIRKVLSITTLMVLCCGCLIMISLRLKEHTTLYPN